MQNQVPIPITGLILAGGQGRRMGGADKGLVRFKGKTLVEHQIALFENLKYPVYISCNRNLDYYSSLTKLIIKDQHYLDSGPLAGIYEILNHESLSIKEGLLLVVPVDAPLITQAVLAELLQPMLEPGSKIQATLAHDGQRLQPLFCCLRTTVRGQLKEYLDSGERKSQQWLQSLPHQIVQFDQEINVFANINDQQTLSQLSEE